MIRRILASEVAIYVPSAIAPVGNHGYLLSTCLVSSCVPFTFPFEWFLFQFAAAARASVPTEGSLHGPIINLLVIGPYG